MEQKLFRMRLRCVSNEVEVSVERGSGDEVVTNDFSLNENVVVKIGNNMPHEGSTRLDNIIDVNRFSSLKKLLMVTGFVLRFARNLLKNSQVRMATSLKRRL